MANPTNISQKAAPTRPKPKSEDEILTGFQTLHTEQQMLSKKIIAYETDEAEHKEVIETLRGVDGSRKCFRMVGGVLVQRTVADVLPELECKYTHLPKSIKVLQQKLAKKGQEINEYVECHNIRMQRVERPPAAPEADPPTTCYVNVFIAKKS